MLLCFDTIVTFQLHCFTGYRKEYYVVKLKDALKPFVYAARNIILKSTYAILITGAIMLTVHILGIVVFHYLKTREVFLTRQIHQLRKLPLELNDSMQMSMEEDEGGFKSYQSHRSPAAAGGGGGGGGKGTKTPELLTEFDYSETRV